MTTDIERDAERWRTFTSALRGRLAGPAHGRRLKVVEVCPMYGDENEVRNLEKMIDEAIAAKLKGATK